MNGRKQFVWDVELGLSNNQMVDYEVRTYWNPNLPGMEEDVERAAGIEYNVLQGKRSGLTAVSASATLQA